MKSTTSFSFIILAFTAFSGVFSAPANLENESPTTDLVERQSGVTCSQTDVAITVTDAIPINETSAIQKRNYNGFCTEGNQICQLRFTSGNFICQGYCHCSIASPCYDDDNYCFYATATGQCICDT